MKAYKLILEYLIENPNIDSINESSELDIGTFKEMVNSGLVSGMNACSDLGDCFLEPKITFRGREWLESKKSESVVKAPQEDIVEIKPNFMGMGLNLNALYRYFKRN